MAIFNPNVEEVKLKEYGEDSRSIRTIPIKQADTSLGVLLKGTGDVLEGGLKATDYLLTENLKENIVKDVEPIRNQFISELETARGGPKTVLTPEPDVPLSADMKRLAPRARTLAAARDNNSISDTQYQAEIVKLSTAYQNRLPGKKDVIVSTISQETGGIDANSYAKGLIRDINANRAKGADETKSVIRLLESNLGSTGYTDPQGKVVSTDVPKMIDYVKRTGDVQAAYEFLTPILAQKRNLEMDNLQLQNRNLNRKDQTELAEISMTREAAEVQARKRQVDMTTAGVRSVDQLFQDVTLHNKGQLDVPLTGKQLEEATLSAAAQKEEMLAELRASFNAPGPGGSPSRASLLGPEKTNAILNSAATVHDAVTKLATGGHIPASDYLSRVNKHIIEQGKFGLLSGTGDIHDAIRNIAFFNGVAPEYAQEYFKQGLGSGKMQALKTFIQTGGLNMHIGKDLRTSGVPLTPKKIMNTANANGGLQNPDGTTTSDGKQFTKDLVNMLPQAMLSPKLNTPEGDQIKLNMANSYFDPVNNAGFVGSLAERHKAFSTIASPSVLTEIKRLSDKHDTALWGKVKTWTENTFGFDIFRNDIARLHDIQMNPNIELVWSSENQKFGVREFIDPNASREEQAQANSPYTRLEASSADRLVQNLNSGLLTMKGLYELDGGSKDRVEAKLMQLLMTRGFDPTQGRVGGIPDAIMKAIKASRPKKEEEKK